MLVPLDEMRYVMEKQLEATGRQVKNHITTYCLVLMTSFYALKPFAKDLKNTNIQLKLDNTSALHCTYKMRSRKPETLNSIVKQL